MAWVMRGLCHIRQHQSSFLTQAPGNLAQASFDRIPARTTAGEMLEHDKELSPTEQL